MVEFTRKTAKWILYIKAHLSSPQMRLSLRPLDQHDLIKLRSRGALNNVKGY